MLSGSSGQTPQAITVTGGGFPGVVRVSYAGTLTPPGSYDPSHWSLSDGGAPVTPSSAARTLDGQGVLLTVNLLGSTIVNCTYDGAQPSLAIGGIPPAAFNLAVPFP